MNARVPALLGALALGVVALTGCSGLSAAGGADLAGARQPLLQAGPGKTPGTLTTAPLTPAEWELAQESNPCSSSGSVTYCQRLQSVGDGDQAHIEWTAYISLPQTTADVQMLVGEDTLQGVATVQTQGPRVMVTWVSPDLPYEDDLYAAANLRLGDGTSYCTGSEETRDANDDLFSPVLLKVLPRDCWYTPPS